MELFKRDRDESLPANADVLAHARIEILAARKMVIFMTEPVQTPADRINRSLRARERPGQRAA
ncbi:hypothetical protein A6456_34295 [Paraburkholderia tropica]|nr:hypothetical protein A6456_34295 [Paraburkholderia tropica]